MRGIGVSASRWKVDLIREKFPYRFSVARVRYGARPGLPGTVKMVRRPAEVIVSGAAFGMPLLGCAKHLLLDET